ncbi:phosphatidylinositol-glycan biosynthesis class S protein-domain-containing protein, partial [Fimicolochytrium jonesii]|uniref:phosphatidylinositol-glycan biosynthesis class S protein-domain-containing protein n=1 Tax=Fimicolochytrium jonesii TaxID=1396493 RepID=UPI0022FE7A18
RLQVVLCILATFLLGTPIWWKTTEVHRAPLPVKKIKAWVLPEVDIGRRWRRCILAEWDNMRTMKYAAQYQVTFSLLVANPSDFLVSWDIQDAVNAYIDPLFDALSDISDFDVHSQIQNYATLPVTPEIVEKDGRKLHILKPSVLPRFINSAEWTLASVVSTAPPLNHILYIPSLEQSPLQLVKDNGEPLSTNAFLMPRWGGVVIQNPEVRGKGSRIHLNATSLHPFMEVAVAHLRDLLGVKKVRIPNADSVLPEISSIVYASAPLTGLTQWEHGRLVRWRTVQNMVDAIDTLNSLSNLIERLESMVVLDDIQSQVVQALQSLREAHKTLSQSHTPSEYTLALQHSKKATVLASKAFFDPTMLAMLYFPDEHKYAVYMPLFVPISVPVLVAAMKELKRALKRRKAKRAGRAGKETGGGNSPAIGLDGPDMDADEEDGAEKENKEE